MTMVHLAKYGSAQVINEVGWRLRKEVTRETYLRDLVYAEDLRFPVHEWQGKDREGRPMVVSWVAMGADGPLLAAYEIQGRAQAYVPGTRVTLDDPEFGPWYGTVVVCLCKRHKWQRQVADGGPGRECGHARCGYPASASACPWPLHVRWDGDNESHQGADSLRVEAPRG